MTTTLEEPPVRPSSSPASRLRTTMAAARISLSWMGVRKTLSRQQKSQAAQAFGAEGEFLSAGKKLLDTRHPSFQAVTAIRGRITNYFKGISLPYPEPSIRLIRRDDISPFTVQITTLQAELSEAVEALDAHYGDLRTAARQRLGSLFDPADYPTSLIGLFEVSWDFPSVEPPTYLRQLSPELYQQECERVRSRFDEAVRLAEDAFTSELATMVSHLAERLAGTTDGKPKIFRDSAVANLTDFFERFRTLSVGSNQQLEQLVDSVQQAVRGIEPQSLRDNAGLRQHVAKELSQVQAALDDLLVDRPRRHILRRAK